jgi:ribosomal protein S18 acetylase RimI-like enzyme
METQARLKDGTGIVIRPMTEDDVDKSWAFFQKLPEEDRAYLRVNVTKRRVVEKRTRDMRSGLVKRLVALAGDEIVADGALELAGPGWKEHVAELRLIVAQTYQRKGVGMVMARELYSLASAENIEDVVVEMMAPQVAARRIFQKLGFKEEAVFPRYVKDIAGRKQDLIVMRSELGALWRELEEQMAMSDWQRTR